jgi:hypothetical protein
MFTVSRAIVGVSTGVLVGTSVGEGSGVEVLVGGGVLVGVGVSAGAEVVQATVMMVVMTMPSTANCIERLTF